MANGVQIFTPGDSPANVDPLSTRALQTSVDGLSARALLTSIRRHRLLVAVVVLLFGLAGATAGLGLPPHYKALGALVIYSQPQRIADVQEVLPDQTVDMAAIRSELDTLQSRLVIEQVVRSLALWRYPEFQRSTYPGGWSLENLEANLRELWALVGGSPPTPGPLPRSAGSKDNAPPTPGEIDLAIGKYSGHLLVQNDPQSMTMRVLFTAWTPGLAARIVNAHMEAYRSLQEQAKAKAARRANTWLNQQIAKLRTKLQPAEAAVAAYRIEHHLTGTAEDHSALSLQLAALTSQLIAARADLAENEARAAEIAARTAGRGAAANGPEVISSPTIQALRAQEAALIEREASLRAEFGPDYPDLRRVRSSLADLRLEIAHESGRSYAAASELVARARAREQSIERSINALTAQVNSSDAGLRQLQENADSIRSLLQRFEKRMEETAAEPAFITANSTIITQAAPSAVAKSPIALYLTVSSAFVGIVTGVLLALLIELRDRTFQASWQVEQHFEPRTVGATPRAIRRARHSPADLILDDHRSVFAEAFRLSWTNIHLAIAGPDAIRLGGSATGMAIGITSATTGEGKSTHALALARTAALAGESVVLIDADLRRSGVSRLLDRKSDLTLDDFLAGRCTAGEVVSVEPRSGMHFVPAKPVRGLWTSADFRKFSELLGNLKERFAVLVIDLPPILGLAETVRLSAMTDGIALIIRWARTDRHLVEMAFGALRGAGIAATMPILNDVDLKAQQRRNYHDRTVAYTLYAKYYA